MVVKGYFTSGVDEDQSSLGSLVKGQAELLEAFKTTLHPPAGQREIRQQEIEQRKIRQQEIEQ